MIKGNLYKLTSLSFSDAGYVADVALLPGSEIYKAHFPCKPITPGVCLVQIAVEIASVIEKRNLSLAEAKDIKFLSIISPLEHKSVRYELSKMDDEGRWVVCIYAGGQLCSKMSVRLCNV